MLDRALLLHLGHLAEDADDVVAIQQGHGTELDGRANAVRFDQRDLGIGHARSSGELAREDLPGTASLFRSADGRNWRPRTSPTKRSAAGLSQRTTPARSMTHAG